MESIGRPPAPGVVEPASRIAVSGGRPPAPSPPSEVLLPRVVSESLLPTAPLSCYSGEGGTALRFSTHQNRHGVRFGRFTDSPPSPSAELMLPQPSPSDALPSQPQRAGRPQSLLPDQLGRVIPRWEAFHPRADSPTEGTYSPYKFQRLDQQGTRCSTTAKARQSPKGSKPEVATPPTAWSKAVSKKQRQLDSFESPKMRLRSAPPKGIG